MTQLGKVVYPLWVFVTGSTVPIIYRNSATGSSATVPCVSFLRLLQPKLCASKRIHRAPLYWATKSESPSPKKPIISLLSSTAFSSVSASANIRTSGSVPEKRVITQLPSVKYTLAPSS